MATKKWFKPGKSLNWDKDDGQVKRRRAALASRKGNSYKAAKALLALSNVTQDRDTKRKAYADAMYFFHKHEQEQKGMKLRG